MIIQFICERKHGDEFLYKEIENNGVIPRVREFVTFHDDKNIYYVETIIYRYQEEGNVLPQVKLLTMGQYEARYINHTEKPI